MAITTVTNLGNPTLITYDPYGKVTGIYWTYKYGNLGLLTGDELRLVFDLTKIYAGDNSTLIPPPPFALLNNRTVAVLATSRSIRDFPTLAPYPLTGVGVQHAASDATGSTDRTINARVVTDSCVFRLVLAGDSDPADQVVVGFYYTI